MNTVKYTISTDSITLYHKGKNYSVLRSNPNYKLVVRALENNKNGLATPEDVIRAFQHEGILDWINSYSPLGKNSEPFKYENNTFFFGGKALPKTIADRIRALALEGTDPTPVFRFCERFAKNPSQRSIDQLWSFLEKGGIPFDDDGCFLAYKAVREDLYDIHSGTILNKIGAVIKMDRALVNDDPNAHCHVGLHVGALEYVRGFGPRIVIVKVDPMNVVSVPNDYDCMKMRVCEYTVVGHFLEQMSSTVQSTQKNVAIPTETEYDDFEEEDLDNEDEFDSDSDEPEDDLEEEEEESEETDSSMLDPSTLSTPNYQVADDSERECWTPPNNVIELPSSKSPVPFTTAEELSSLSIKELFELDRTQLNIVAAYYEIIFTEQATPALLIMKINELRSYTEKE